MLKINTNLIKLARCVTNILYTVCARARPIERTEEKIYK